MYSSEFCSAFAAKLGLCEFTHDDVDLLEDLFALMHQAEIDMSEFFRRLAEVDLERPSIDVLQDSFYRADLRQRHSADLARWLVRYAARLRHDPQSPEQRGARTRAVNPRYVLRNYLAQQAIDRAEQGDMQMVHDLLEALRRPFDEQPENQAYAAPPPDWAARLEVSCSS